MRKASRSHPLRGDDFGAATAAGSRNRFPRSPSVALIVWLILLRLISQIEDIASLDFVTSPLVVFSPSSQDVI